MKIKEIKEFIDRNVGFDIAYGSYEFSNRKNEKVFCRWFLTYLCYKYTKEYLTNNSIAEILNITHASVLYGRKEFENLIKYDKDESRNFKILEDIFIEEFNPDTRDLLEVIENNELTNIKHIRNLKIKLNKSNEQIQNLKYQLKKAS